MRRRTRAGARGGGGAGGRGETSKPDVDRHRREDGRWTGRSTRSDVRSWYASRSRRSPPPGPLPRCARRRNRIGELARAAPAAARLVLFAYASELVPHPLDGLRTYEDLALRFEQLGGRDEVPVTLEQGLVEAADLVEFGIRRAGERRVQSGLRFRSAALRDAVPLALRAHRLRVEFRRVLATLGERTGCPECQEEVFAVPLYRLRGLDDLHATACPRCGHLVRSYFLPRGKDVQSVLNTAFLDLELLSEWSFRMGPATVAVQLLPVQVERMTVGQLKRRFWADVLERHGIQVRLEAVRLLQARRPVPERRKLADLDRQDFVVAFGTRAGVSVADALETVRHRIRTRFRPDAAAGTTLSPSGSQLTSWPGFPSLRLAAPEPLLGLEPALLRAAGRPGGAPRLLDAGEADERGAQPLEGGARFCAWLRRSVAVTVTPVGG